LPNHSLGQNYPNPFNPTTTIDFQISESGNTKINIYNINGELVKELLNEEKNRGVHSIFWDGRNNKGEIIPTGTYFYQIQVGDFIQAKKMILLK